VRTRPQPVTVAAILLALLSLPNVLYPLLALKGELVPLIYLTVVFGVAGLIAAAGLWMLKRWALWLTIIVCALGGIFSWAPVIPAAPTALHLGLAAVVVVGSVLTIVLVVLPTSRLAYT
jgi:uncharacterized membrane protein (DUF2068 family)